MKILPVIAALTIAANNVHAATISETSDFENQLTNSILTPVSPAFDFSQIEAYSISGSLNTTCDGLSGQCADDFSDVFSFNMGLNRKIENAFITITNAVAEFEEFFPGSFGGVLNLSVGSGGIAGFGFSDFAGDGTFGGPLVSSLPEGLTHTFGISVRNSGFSDTISADWNISFDVVEIDPEISPVPLPAGGLLLLSGLSGFVALRRRKKPAV
jgi:hypothetical protein